MSSNSPVPTSVPVSDVDAALAAGVVPVAMTEAPVEPVMPWAKDTIDELGGDDPELFQWSTEDTIPFEDIAAWEPDLILATGNIIGEDAYDQLGEIAPTLTTAEEGKAESWQAQTERISTALDRKSQGEKAVTTAQTAIELTVRRGFRGSLQFLPVPPALESADRPTWLNALERAFLPTGQHGLREVVDMRTQRTFELAAPDARPLIWTGEDESESETTMFSGTPSRPGIGSPDVSEQVVELDSTAGKIWTYRPERPPVTF